MQVQRISSVNNFHFKSLSGDRPTLDIEDIYAAEDRIVEKQERLVREQNKLLGEAILRSAIYSAYPNAPGIRDRFLASVEALGCEPPNKLF